MVETLSALYTLFDKLSDGVCLADPDGKAFYINPAAAALLESAAGENPGVDLCGALCSRLELEAGRSALHACPLRGVKGPGKSASFVGRHGPRAAYNWRDDRVKRAERWRDLRVRCLTTWLPLRPGAGEDEVHVVLIEDATPEMDLRRHRADWRNMIAHDLRAPLTSIYSGLCLLEEARPASQDTQESKIVQMARGACKRMMELLDLYLDVARLDAGAMKARLEPVRLSTVVARAIEEQASLADSSGVTLKVEGDAELKALGDADLLQRVAENLLNNAVKYNRRGGRVTISVSRGADGARLSFADTGSGIDPKDLPFIFDRFYQAEARRAGRIQGNGLGLTFCKEALDLMGGGIAVSSRPGEGSEFVVTLKPAEDKP
jgi:signal transduction histidine kinase